MLTQRLVESFLTLAETLSYTEAALRLYLSHQALSKQIAKLEEELGYLLFAKCGCCQCSGILGAG